MLYTNYETVENCGQSFVLNYVISNDSLFSA